MKSVPDFFLVGAAKAGTTALQQALDAHPDVYMSPLKEPNFFCDDILTDTLREDVMKKTEADDIPRWINEGMKGFRWRAYLRDELLYQKLFEPARANQIKGEASVSYLYSKNAAARIREANPAAKIIMVLRHPAERAFSHFQMEKRMGWLNENFNTAFERFKKSTAPVWGRDPLFLAGGLYADQVHRYLQQFPASQLFIVWYDDLKKDPTATLSQMFTFIGVDPAKVDLSKVLTRSNEARDHKLEVINRVVPPGAAKVRLRRFMRRIGLHGILKSFLTKPATAKLNARDRTLLTNYYLSDIEELEKLLSVHLTSWKK